MAFNVLDFQEELTTLKTPSHPDEFGYTKEGYEEWMRKNNPRAPWDTVDKRTGKPKEDTRKFLRPYLNDPIVVDVLERIKKRADEGMQKYGVPLTRKDINTVEWLRHAQEEALDLALYLERIIRDLEDLNRAMQKT